MGKKCSAISFSEGKIFIWSFCQSVKCSLAEELAGLSVYQNCVEFWLKYKLL